MSKRQIFLLSLALLAGHVAAADRELARFSCQRPQPVESGAITNAAIASELVNGIRLEPGEVFSFNHAMSKGLNRFVEGTAYASGKVIRSEGGGVCQVSAAIYNAALLAGLEVLERHSHSVYDPLTAYVPAGRDAAISRSVGADMRFKNSTVAPLSLSLSAQDGRVQVVLLGRQRHPRKRWIVTEEIKRNNHGMRQTMNDELVAGERSLKQKGFDGLRVRRRLCKAGAEGVTECASLGADDYMMVTEVWEQGKATVTGQESAAALSISTETP